MIGIPPAVLALIIGMLIGSAAPILIAAYHRLIRWVFAKTGVTLPDNAAIDAGIVAIMKALIPELIAEIATGKLDPQRLVQIILAAVGKTNPAAATTLKEHLTAGGVLTKGTG